MIGVSGRGWENENGIVVSGKDHQETEAVTKVSGSGNESNWESVTVPGKLGESGDECGVSGSGCGIKLVVSEDECEASESDCERVWEESEAGTEDCGSGYGTVWAVNGGGSGEREGHWVNGTVGGLLGCWVCG